MAFCQTWQQLLSVRIVLGVFKSGLYPSLGVNFPFNPSLEPVDPYGVYLVSTWYTRNE